MSRSEEFYRLKSLRRCSSMSVFQQLILTQSYITHSHLEIPLGRYSTGIYWGKWIIWGFTLLRNAEVVIKVPTYLLIRTDLIFWWFQPRQWFDILLCWKKALLNSAPSNKLSWMQGRHFWKGGSMFMLFWRVENHFFGKNEAYSVAL